jgi:predicted unusual protein kinase regulating ubiquinone biosynthesis (AarF/ABC1/UbiB family)
MSFGDVTRKVEASFGHAEKASVALSQQDSLYEELLAIAVNAATSLKRSKALLEMFYENYDKLEANDRQALGSLMAAQTILAPVGLDTDSSNMHAHRYASGIKKVLEKLPELVQSTSAIAETVPRTGIDALAALLDGFEALRESLVVDQEGHEIVDNDMSVSLAYGDTYLGYAYREET